MKNHTTEPGVPYGFTRDIAAQCDLSTAGRLRAFYTASIVICRQCQYRVCSTGLTSGVQGAGGWCGLPLKKKKNY